MFRLFCRCLFSSRVVYRTKWLFMSICSLWLISLQSHFPNHQITLSRSAVYSAKEIVSFSLLWYPMLFFWALQSTSWKRRGGWKWSLAEVLPSSRLLNSLRMMRVFTPSAWSPREAMRSTGLTSSLMVKSCELLQSLLKILCDSFAGL